MQLARCFAVPCIVCATKLEWLIRLATPRKATGNSSALHLHEDTSTIIEDAGFNGYFDETAQRVFKNSKTSAFLRQDNLKLACYDLDAQFTRNDYTVDGIFGGKYPRWRCSISKVHGVDIFNYMDQTKTLIYCSLKQWMPWKSHR